MRKITPVLALALILQIGGYAQSSSFRISAIGFGPVKPGMTVKQAAKALGTKLVAEGAPEGGCTYVNARAGLADLFFMVMDGRIARVDTDSRAYRTQEGARVGDTETRIKLLYRGRYKIEPHKYVDGHYIIVGDRKRAVIFETDGKNVTMIRAGRYPEVGWIEGCS